MKENESTIDFIEVQIKSFVENMRPPVEIRDQLDIDYKYDKSSIELYEIRPHFEIKDKIIHSSFAKARFIKSRNIWRIYWMRASGKWDPYEPDLEVSYVKDFLEIVNEDKYGCFKG